MMMSNNGVRNRSSRALILLVLVVGIIIPHCCHAQHSSLRSEDHEEVGSTSTLSSSFDITTTDDTTSPTLSDCLLSAVNSNDCGTIVAGCIWCAEPIYGLCVTKTAAEKMKVMPFFKCNLSDATSDN
ncbi:hypothetical protein ACHAWU_005207 [Discostella pseudostelligera]|uniref:Uncharacterized protein n=1 Tax=Discostella pseudostelligera TaxID=259834 RepID=A0ABD3MKM7_9STRA